MFDKSEMKQNRDPVPDEELMRRAQNDDPRAFDILIERHSARVFNHVLRATGDRSLAEDLLQDTFLRAFQARKSWRSEARFSTWLLTIARNLLADRFRWLKRWKMVPIDQEPEKSLPNLRALTDDPEAKILLRESHQEVREAIMLLPEKQREVLLLSRYGKLSYAEIAKLTGSTEEAIKQRAYRGLVVLRQELAVKPTGKEESHVTTLRKHGS